MSSNGNGLSPEKQRNVEMYFANRGFRYVADYSELRSIGLSEKDVNTAMLTGYLAFNKSGYALSRRTLAEIGLLVKPPRGLSDDLGDQLPVYTNQVGAYMAQLIDSQVLNSGRVITRGEVDKAIGRDNARRLQQKKHFRTTNEGVYEITTRAVKCRIEGRDF